MKRNFYALLTVCFLLVACQDIPVEPKNAQPDWSAIPGALVGASMESTVGVLLDDIPAEDREQFAASLQVQPESFWKDRAKRQIRLTSHRLNFGSQGGKKQLPLPPEELWTINLLEEPKQEQVEGHDVVTVRYRFSGILLTDEESPGLSAATLARIGGVWNEQFLFPVDPEFVFQRTGFACINEGQFPPNSFDAEEVDLFYDQNCRVERSLSNIGCHQTAMPSANCDVALAVNIGSVDVTMQFTRLPWDREIADSVRVGEFTNLQGSDLQPYKEGFLQHRFAYRYIPKDSCTLVEQCVGDFGWRRLLQFPIADFNSGTEPLEIGRVDYFHQENGTDMSDHGIFEFSACHEHYHFSHYGSFDLGDGSEEITRKNAFCLQPSSRLWNNELSPLHHSYVDCVDQGVSVGWLDEYKIGLECQWIDISNVKPNRDMPLSFTTNPDGMLCEGTPVLDARGNPLFEATTFKTVDGKPVDRAQCEKYAEWELNNTVSYDVHIPDAGESYVTAPCREGLFGELRNCGLTNKKHLSDCTPGKKVTVNCSIPAKTSPQVVRICEGSKHLQMGIPCTYNDALASTTIHDTENITFTCPIARDGRETGGTYSFLTGALFPDEEATEVTCRELL